MIKHGSSYLSPPPQKNIIIVGPFGGILRNRPILWGNLRPNFYLDNNSVVYVTLKFYGLCPQIVTPFNKKLGYLVDAFC